MVIAMICMTNFPNPIPMIENELFRALPVAFCLSEYKNYTKYYKQLKYYKLSGFIIIVLLGTLLFLIHSPHSHESLKTVVVHIISNLFQTYLVFPILFCLCLKSFDISRLYKVVYYCLLFITFWGVINLILHRGIFIDILYSGRDVVSYMSDLGMKYSNSDRFRVQSVFLNAFNYGYINLMILLFNLYCYNTKVESVSRFRFVISLGCTLFGIYFCNCRTVLLCFLVSLIVYALLAFKFGKKIRILILSTIVGVFILNYTQLGSAITERIVSVFSDQQMSGSSSMSMRETQWLTVLSLTKDKMLLGNGDGYFFKDLNFKSGESDVQGLMALEGIYLQYILERGIVGLVYYYTIWLGLIIYMLRRRNKDHITVAFGISIVSTYLAFAHATGELQSLLPTLFFMGIAIYVINTNDKNVYFQTKHLTNEIKS